MTSERKLRKRKPNDLDRQAAYWLARLMSEQRSAAMLAAFEAWRDEAPDHALAFDRVCRAYGGAHAFLHDAEFAELRREALRNAYRPRAPRTWRLWSSMAAIAAVAAALLFFVMHPIATPTVFTTEIGEQSTALLPDGSRVELNTDTELRIRFTAAERRVDMEGGQAVFSVAQDASRPFVVIAGGRRITALGTEFEVRVVSENLAVTLIDGRVVVDELNPAARDAALAPPTTKAVELSPGQRLTAAPGASAAVNGANLSTALSWREGRLDFNDESLATVVAEFNRYSVRKLVIAEPALAELRVSGSFQLGSVDNFAAALAAVYPVRTEHRADDGAIVIEGQ